MNLYTENIKKLVINLKFFSSKIYNLHFMLYIFLILSILSRFFKSFKVFSIFSSLSLIFVILHACFLSFFMRKLYNINQLLNEEEIKVNLFFPPMQFTFNPIFISCIYIFLLIGNEISSIFIRQILSNSFNLHIYWLLIFIPIILNVIIVFFHTSYFIIMSGIVLAKNSPIKFEQLLNEIEK